MSVLDYDFVSISGQQGILRGDIRYAVRAKAKRDLEVEWFMQHFRSLPEPLAHEGLNRHRRLVVGERGAVLRLYRRDRWVPDKPDRDELGGHAV
jgi:hypothetical protein